jgi:hypothetical protein
VVGLAERVPDDGRHLPPPEAVTPEPVTLGDTGPGDPGAVPVTRTGLWTFLVAAVAVLLVIWFFIAWLGLDRTPADAAGESVGTALALLLVVSAIGAFRDRAR